MTSIKMNKNDVINILERLKSESFFSDFKIRKSDSSIIQKTGWGYRRVNFLHYNSVDRDQLALRISPHYWVRFDFLHKWFEKFSYKPLSVQKNTGSVAFSEEMLDKSKTLFGFYFLESREDYELDYEVLKKDVIEHASYVFNRFQTLNDLYEYKVQPILDGEAKFPFAGAEWMFQYLLMARVLHPEDYEHLKTLILQYASELRYRKHPEPNVLMYYDKIPEIMNYMETMPLDIPKELIR